MAAAPAVAVLTLASSITLSAQPLAAQASTVVEETGHFQLLSGPRAALHYLLRAWAMADAGEWPPYALPLVEREAWDEELDADEASTWTDAVHAYDRVRGRSLLFDEGLLAVREWAAGAGDRSAIPPSDRALADAVEAALPIYLRHWWPAHEGRNRDWIRAVAPTLRDVEGEMVSRLEAAYGGTWPDGRIPVAVVPYANEVGAYSSAGRITMSSRDRDNGMPQAVELVFHEASHTDPMEGSLREALQEAFRAVGSEEPNRFWHDVIFYTAGETLRLVLEQRGQSYRHYGETAGVYSRGERWSTELPALRHHWGPFLASGASDAAARGAALQAVTREMTGAGSRPFPWQIAAKSPSARTSGPPAPGAPRPRP